MDRQTGFLLPPSVDEWLPEKHLARYVVEVIEHLDTRAMEHAHAKVRGEWHLVTLAWNVKRMFALIPA